MDVIKHTRPRTLGDLVVFEVDTNYCRERGTLLGGSSAVRTARQFAVLGAIALGAATVTPAAAVSATSGTVGNGSIGTPTADSGAPAGKYRVTIVSSATNVGQFEVTKPDGTLDGVGTVAVAYNGTINFTLADGSADWVEDDYIEVTVSYAAGSGKLKEIDFAAVDGSQNAVGIAPVLTTAPDGVDVDLDYLARGPMIVRSEELIWPDGASDSQKAAATLQLKALGILVRASG